MDVNQKIDPDTIYKANFLWLPKNLISFKWIKDNLFFSMIDKRGRTITYKLWYENKTHWILPRHVNLELKAFNTNIVDLNPKEYEQTLFDDKVKSFVNKLQEESYNVLLKANNGILNLAPGKGKTVLMLKKIAAEQKPTIIILYNTSLMAQWESQARKFLGYEGKIGRIQAGVNDWKHPFTVASYMTLAKHPERITPEIAKYFGVVVFDECHHAAAPTLQTVLPLFWGKRYGLTATVERSDGLENIFKVHLGDVIHTDNNYEVPPIIFFIETGTYKFGSDFNPQAIQLLISKVANDTDRNHLLITLIRRLIAKDRKILIISDRLQQIRKISQQIDCAVLTGKTPKDQRYNLLANSDVTIATKGVGLEGLDSPRLDTIIFATPFSFWGSFRQGMGRALRAYPGKNRGNIFYLWDTKIPPFYNMGQKIIKNIRNEKYPFYILSRAKVLEKN